MEVIRNKYVVYLLIFKISTIFSWGQEIKFSNNDIACKFNYNIVNDSICIFKYYLENICKEDIYLHLPIGEFDQDNEYCGVERDKIVIPFNVNVGFMTEIIHYSEILKNHDTLTGNIKIIKRNIYSQKSFLLYITYIKPTNYQEKIKNEILEFTRYSNISPNNLYFIDSKNYSKYCDFITIEIKLKKEE